MPLAWAPGLQRTQVIRRAAKILALHREMEGSTPDQWRIQELAKRMLIAVSEQAGRSWTVEPVALRRVGQRVRDLDAGTEQRQEGVILGQVCVDSENPAIYPMVESDREWVPDGDNLLNNPQFWTHGEAHDFLRNIVALTGMACAKSLVGPWQIHDRSTNAVHRAAMAAYLCESAYNDEMQWNPPWMARASHALNPQGMMDAMLGLDTPASRENSFGVRFVEPWKARFDAALQSSQTLAAQDGSAHEWKFAVADESHWSLELCWSIVKESYNVRLDCPPHVVPLHFLADRQGRTIEQALYQYLVDHPDGPRMKAANAANLLAGDPHNVHELLSQARKRVSYDVKNEAEEPWDPLSARNHPMMPMALRTTDSARKTPIGAPTKPEPTQVGNGGENHSQE